MVVYHGSNHNFRTLRISKSLAERRSSAENEGYGIYFSTDREVAESYGKYVYTLEINDEHLIDFTKRATCQQYLSGIRYDVLRKFNIDIFKYIDWQTLVTNMYCGGVCIFQLGSRELYLCLDSNWRWFEDVKPTKMQEIYKYLRRYDKALKAYTFNYHIKNIGVIKNVDPSVVKIINKESRWVAGSDRATQLCELFRETRKTKRN